MIEDIDTVQVTPAIHEDIGSADVAGALIRFAVKHPSAVMRVHEDLVDRLNPSYFNIHIGCGGNKRVYMYCGIELMVFDDDERLYDEEEGLYSVWLYKQHFDRYPINEVLIRE